MYVIKREIMRFEKYYYDVQTEGVKDCLDPRVVLDDPRADMILSAVIEKEPFMLSFQDFDSADLAQSMLEIDVLKEHGGRLALAVPVFIEADIPSLKRLSEATAETIYARLKKHKDKLQNIVRKLDNGFSDKINLYHLLCGSVFDGSMFDYLEENALITTSKKHENGMDYLLIMYEKSKRMMGFSNCLLCSYNRFASEKGVFSSFGDCDGARKDLYRYKVMQKLGRLSAGQEPYAQMSADQLAMAFNSLIDGDSISDQYIRVFDYFGYTENGRISVPVYGERAEAIRSELYALVVDLCGDLLHNILSVIGSEENLLSVRHEVDVRDIGNEVYHLIFGTVNEMLVKEGMVATPDYFIGEGRYLKAYERLA